MLEEVRTQLEEEKLQIEDITKILTKIVEVGLRGSKSFLPTLDDVIPQSRSSLVNTRSTP